jgi:inorganic pyrophosphatase
VQYVKRSSNFGRLNIEVPKFYLIEVFMDITKIPVGQDVPKDVNVIIEVPMGGEPIKYEIDKASGAMFVDRFLYTPMRYPTNYGFIPGTLSGDGDPVDVLCIGRRALIPGCVLRVKPVGVLLMEDQAGIDEKIIGVPVSSLTAFYDGTDSYKQLPAIQLAQIEHFFAHYKDLEPGKWTKIQGWKDRDVAEQLILEGIDRHNAYEAEQKVKLGV